MIEKQFIKAQNKLLAELIEDRRNLLEMADNLTEINRQQGALQVIRYLMSSGYAQNFTGTPTNKENEDDE